MSIAAPRHNATPRLICHIRLQYSYFTQFSPNEHIFFFFFCIKISIARFFAQNNTFMEDNL